jgi:hypothetical protein
MENYKKSLAWKKDRQMGKIQKMGVLRHNKR